MVVLLYTAGISEYIRRVSRKYGMRVIFKSGLSLLSVVTKVKDVLPMDKWSKGSVLDPLQLLQELHW